MPMSLLDQSMVARKLMIARICARGIPGKRELGKDLADAAAAVGIDPEEMRNLYIDLLPEVLANIFGVKEVVVTFK